MIITTFETIRYDNRGPFHWATLASKPPDKAWDNDLKEYISLNKGSKWKLISTCFDSENKIIYYSWELI